MAPRLAAGVRATTVDVAAILAVAALLVAVHWLVPGPVREQFAYHYASPDPLSAVTAAYVHASAAHLRGNVAGYLAACGFAYLLARYAGERRWFRLSFLAYLAVLPIAVGMTSAAVVDAAVVGRGFSGVVAGFAGFVLVGPAVVLPRVFGYDRWVGWTVVAALTIVVGAEIVWVVRSGIPLDVGVVFAVGLALTVGLLARPAVDPANRPADRDGRLDLAGAATVSIVVLAVVSVFVVGLFPADIVGEDGVTNILAHYLGLVFGAVIAGWGYRYWSTVPRGGESGQGDGPGNRRS